MDNKMMHPTISKNPGDDMTGSARFPKPTAFFFEQLVEIGKRSDLRETREPIIVTLLTKNMNLKGIVTEFSNGTDIVFHMDGSNDYALIKLKNLDGVVIHNYMNFAHMLVGLNSKSEALYNEIPFRKGDLKRTLLRESKRLTMLTGRQINIACQFQFPDVPFDAFLCKNIIIDMVSALCSITTTYPDCKILDGANKLILRKGELFQLFRQANDLIVVDGFERSYSTKTEREYLVQLMLACYRLMVQ